MIRVLIVDDEPLARTAIRNMLRDRAGFELAGEAGGGAEAVAAIRSLRPDLVFLDIQMPELDGFGVLESIGAANAPEIIFVTAYDGYAVRAFEAHAIDYLLKPFEPERFEAALHQARRRIAAGAPGGTKNDAPAPLDAFAALLREVRGGRLERVIVRAGGHALLLAAREIDWIEAQGNYVNLHLGPRAYLLRESIAALEAKLDQRRFRRIHRSTMVNLESIRELRPAFHGAYEVVMRDGTLLKLSHRYRANLEEAALGAL